MLAFGQTRCSPNHGVQERMSCPEWWGAWDISVALDRRAQSRTQGSGPGSDVRSAL